MRTLNTIAQSTGYTTQEVKEAARNLGMRVNRAGNLPPEDSAILEKQLKVSKAYGVLTGNTRKASSDPNDPWKVDTLTQDKLDNWLLPLDLFASASLIEYERIVELAKQANIELVPDKHGSHGGYGPVLVNIRNSDRARMIEAVQNYLKGRE